ncbi:hypothetical protein ACQ33O_01910 [Ferruginibacter sp. SUN002]|uniref:hypothetical protein n=1 Tax=Ferruginibacter sp. SUN002 TaxID=2937789 RepID=UPI003D365E5B
MKKIYFILTFILFTGIVNAQDDPAVDSKKQQDIEALKVAFISKELDLTPDEAQKFWPIYNQYSKEYHKAVKDNHDVLDRDEKVLNIRKKYKDQFVKLLGLDRTNKMYSAEGRFHKLLIKAMKKRNEFREKKGKGNRPMLRKGD